VSEALRINSAVLKMPVNRLREEVHSEEVHEIIGAVPHWLIRWGTGLFFALLFMLLLFSAFIKSPDVVPARLRVTITHRPLEVMARRQGRLTTLLVSDGDVVKKGDLLGVIECRANVDDVLLLSSLVDTLQVNLLKGTYTETAFTEMGKGQHYGELQPAVQEFYLAYAAYLNYAPDGYMEHRVEVIHKEIKALARLEEQLRAQQEIYYMELKLAEDVYDRDKVLFDSQVTSKQEFGQQEGEYLRHKIRYTKSRLPALTTRWLIR
jgi:multidrug efflux pump subunit AcrA (membrane-fusion protein)